MEKSLFERIGGEAAVKAAVDKMYEKILADDLLVPFFTKTNMDEQRRKQRLFVTYAFGGSDHYYGKGMRVVHAQAVKDGLSDKHFDAVAGHLKAAMQELNVPEDLVTEALAIVETTRDDVLGKPEGGAKLA